MDVLVAVPRKKGLSRPLMKPEEQNSGPNQLWGERHEHSEQVPTVQVRDIELADWGRKEIKIAEGEIPA